MGWYWVKTPAGSLTPAEHWNGHTWFVQPTAQPTANELLTAVACGTGIGCTRHQIFLTPLAQRT